MNTSTIPAHMPLRGTMLAAPAAVLLAVLAGCGSGSDEPQPGKSTAELIATILQATPNAVTPEQVAEAFALGSNSTDLQRDLIEKDLVGSVVEWDIQVYEVSYADRRYRVSSQPIPIASTEAVQLLRIVAIVSAQRPADDELLQTIKTNDALRIRGLVEDIALRTVLTIGPAVVVTEKVPNGAPPE